MEAICLATTDVLDTETLSILPERSLLYCTADDSLYMKFGDTWHNVSGNNPDLVNIFRNSSSEYYLGDYIKVKRIDITPDGGIMNANYEELGTCSSSQRTLLLMPYDTDVLYGMCGEILDDGESVQSVYHFTLNSSGTFSLHGCATTLSKANVVKATYNDTVYLGVQFTGSQDSTVYFHGFDNRNGFSLSGYTDNDLSNIKILKES